MRFKTVTAAAGILVAWGIGVDAGTVTNGSLRPVSVTASGTYDADRVADHTLDGSGLNADGQHTNQQTATMWLSTNLSPSVRLDYDLGAVHVVSGLAVWNYNHTGKTQRGMKDARILASVQLPMWSLVDDVTVTQANGLNSYAGETITFPEHVRARYIRIDSDTNHGSPANSLWGLSELRCATPRWISNVTATASSAYSAARGPEETVNNSGMAGFGNEHVAVTSPDNAMWLTVSQAVTNHWIRFDLHAVHPLAAMVVWNYNQATYTGRGIATCAIRVSRDAATWSTLTGPDAGHYSLSQAPGTAPYVAADVIDLAGVEARYVQLNVLTNHNAAATDYVGLSEVRFYEALPRPPAVASDSLRPAAVTASSELDGTRVADNTIDGSGLDAGGGHTNSPVNTMWLTALTNAATITCDLGAVLDVSGLYVWNYNHNDGFDGRNRGFKAVAVQASRDGTAWRNLGDMEFAKADGTPSDAGESIVFPRPVPARYVRLTPGSTWGGASGAMYWGLSELRCVTPRWISNVTATASSAYTRQRSAAQTVNGSGMAGFANEHVSTTGADDAMWLTVNDTVTNHYITFDLQDVYVLGMARVWNYNQVVAFNGRGIATFDIQTSSDGLTWSTLSGPDAGHYSLAKAPGSVPYGAADVVDLDGAKARYVRFRVLTNHNGNATDFVGLSEVRFYEAWIPSGSLIAIR
jgi:hypothetical protein